MLLIAFQEKNMLNFSHHHLLKLKNVQFNKAINYDYFTIDKSINLFFNLIFFLNGDGGVKSKCSS